MMWFYITAYAVLFGAEVNAALDREWNREKSSGQLDAPAAVAARM